MITWILIISILNLLALGGLFYRLYQIAQRIKKADERARIQVDSYGATVGELLDYVENKLKEEK